MNGNETVYKILITGQTATSDKFYCWDESVVVYVGALACGETHCFTPNKNKPVCKFQLETIFLCCVQYDKTISGVSRIFKGSKGVREYEATAKAREARRVRAKRGAF